MNETNVKGEVFYSVPEKHVFRLGKFHVFTFVFTNGNRYYGIGYAVIHEPSLKKFDLLATQSYDFKRPEVSDDEMIKLLRTTILEDAELNVIEPLRQKVIKEQPTETAFQPIIWHSTTTTNESVAALRLLRFRGLSDDILETMRGQALLAEISKWREAIIDVRQEKPIELIRRS